MKSTPRIKHVSRAAAVALVVASTAVTIAATAFAANNQASGDVAGNPASLGNSNVFTINSTQLALVKAAFLANGTPIASGATVAKGTWVKFMIYVDNATIASVDSVNVQDALVASFAYQPGTIRVDATANTGSTAAAIYAAVNAAAPLTDAVSAGDVAGISGSTISAGSGSGNAMVTVPAGKVWAMLFMVKVQ